ncbi:hypothetical protein CWATWH0401_4681 [Crocosphaera watsonii WH 0401]|uniref:Uncharacterized protein n=1 Tax=Crocosphaera watsonii WH 0401 TaxID=555881 RepID=T2JCI4_CROWT|nr:hypothetical protein CWATWH0401_4681 [Crocosphaera watsonii WH 0401]
MRSLLYRKRRTAQSSHLLSGSFAQHGEFIAREYYLTNVATFIKYAILKKLTNQ